MPSFIYSCLFYLLLPFVFVRLLWRSVREPEYRAVPLERLGFYQSSHPGNLIWVHAVSAGEAIAAVPLIRGLVAAGYRCLVTNMTPTGRERVRHLLGDLMKSQMGSGKQPVENCYAPYDTPTAISRFIRYNRPRMLIIIDTELWPNMIRQCRQREIPIALVNARMSAGSARGYGRIGLLSRPMMAALNLVATQTQQHAERFLALGVPAERIVVTGSIKFDALPPAAPRLESARHLTAGRPVLVGASTHDGEELALLRLLPALQEVIPNVLLILAPRHTHRSDSVSRLCESMGYQVTRFSTLPTSVCGCRMQGVVAGCHG